ncbi:hypothetical protein EG327_006940 [Venturia inaequalis]|uniref:YCII-related domain-containing protein n=1 Tax=Venturia inaequalis TaxID=5025 RepID=A0A8H3V248_VENIN|nr:hypothetical protein EG327_006940 [Venturia inaequalis]
MATSSTSGKKIEWLVILPDREGVIERRMEVRPSHLANVQQDADSGFWLLGGAYFSDVPKAGENPPPIIGSAMLAHAETKEEVLEKLKRDVYSESGVWDWEKVRIYPFRNPASWKSEANMSTSEKPSAMPSLKFGKNLMQQLEEWGAIRDDEHFVEPTIEKTVHPLLARNHWEHGLDDKNMTSQRWEHIEPAIHLASHLLESINTSWWSKLMWATVLEDATKTPPQRYLAEIEESEELKQATRDTLVQMAEVVRFFPERRVRIEEHNQSLAVTSGFLPTSDCDKRAEYYDFTKNPEPFSRVALVDDLPGAGARLRRIWNTLPIIGIDFHPKIWQGFENLHNPQFVAPGKRKGLLRRLQFSLAISIVHELTHAAWIYTRTLNGLSLEQAGIRYHATDKIAEFGQSWEMEVFQALLRTLSPIPRDLQCFLPPAGAVLGTTTPPSGKKEDSGSSSSSDAETSQVSPYEKPRNVFYDKLDVFVVGYFPTVPVFVRFEGIMAWMVVSDEYISSWFRKENAILGKTAQFGDGDEVAKEEDKAEAGPSNIKQ